MREVAWVVFDEIHYMRDKGMLKFEGFSGEIQYSQLWFLWHNKLKSRISKKWKIKDQNLHVIQKVQKLDQTKTFSVFWSW